MKFARFLLSALAVGFIGSAAVADDFNKATVFTVDQAFVIPGAQYTNHQTTVPAGTYVLKFIDQMGTQNVAYLYDSNEQYLIATALTIPVSFRDGHYADPAYDKMVQFRPGKTKGAPLRLVRWFYPGYSEGWGFRDR